MITVRAATDADKAGILALLTAIYGARHTARIEHLWDWQWRQDPRLPQPGYRGTVAEWQGRIIGNMGMMPAALYVDGRLIDACCGVDASVHPGWMREALRAQRREGEPRRGNAVSADLLDHPTACPVIFGKLVSEPMQVVARKIGFRTVTGSGFMQRRVSYAPHIARFTGTAVARLLAAPADLILAGLPRGPASIETLEGDFDTRFDQLWERVAGDYPGITLRDAAVLNWRYRRHPLTRYTTLIDHGDSRLRGYVVINTSIRHRRKRGHIVDLLVQRDDVEGATRLLAAATRELRIQGAGTVDCFVCEPSQRPALETLGFQERRKSIPLLVRGLPETQPLYITAGDGDGG